MRTAIVTLDGQQYTVEEKRSSVNRAWREAFEKSPAAAAIQSVKTGLNVDLDNVAGLVGLAGVVINAAFMTPDEIKGLVVDYEPRLAAIDCYDSEWIDALLAVVSVVYPFGPLVKSSVGLVQTGLGQAQTSTKSASVNGSASLTPSTP